MSEKPTEGDLYANVSVSGREFTLRYGYYEDLDRESGEPIPIYPDLKSDPVYSQDGRPIVTQMQIACSEYLGPESEDNCGHCSFFLGEKLLFGICASPKQIKSIK